MIFFALPLPLLGWCWGPSWAEAPEIDIYLLFETILKTAVSKPIYRSWLDIPQPTVISGVAYVSLVVLFSEIIVHAFKTWMANTFS